MNHRHAAIPVVGVAALIMFAAAPVAAQLRAEVVASGFELPVVVVPDPSAPSTFIVAEQAGLILAAVNGVTQATPFLDLTSEVKFQNEQGVLGLAFSPDGTRVFVSFVKKRTPDLGIGDLVVARFRRSANPLTLDTSSRFELIWPGGQPFIFQATAVHKGGNLAFGPDGYLYMGLGDAGGLSNPNYNAQHPSVLIGKMLRLDVDVPDAHAQGYVIPPDNPFVDAQPIAALHEIWAFGFRNPWRFSFDDYGPGATDALIIGDVGEASREEINYEPAGRGGRNYGWYLKEGSIDTPGVPPTTLPAYGPLTGPVADYPRSIGRAVTGGYV
ncbi:MAG: PQQ-dependent sugar dehydrogenase, partial [Vicinamibacterales bacterium]